MASALVVALPLFASSCAGDGTKVPLLDDDAGPEPAFAPKLSAIYDNVIAPTCTPGCHEPGGTSPFVLSTLADSYANLVNVPNGEGGVDANGLPFLRVEPGFPNRSYIILKLKGSPSIVGDRMPLSQPPLDSGTIAIIAEWISKGAPND